MKPIFPGSALGWVTAMGAVFVIVVMVAAGIIKVDILRETNTAQAIAYIKSYNAAVALMMMINVYPTV